MRAFLSARLHLLCFLVSVQFTSMIYARDPEITFYDLKFEIIPAECKLLAQTEIKIKLPDNEPVSELPIRLYCNNIDYVKDAGNRDLNYSKTDNQMIIRFDSPVRDSIIIRIKYDGVYKNPYISGCIGTKSTWLLMESDYYPKISEDIMGGFDYKLQVTVPDSLYAVCSGELRNIDSLNKKRTFYYESLMPEIALSISAARYNISTFNAGGIQVKTYIFPEHASSKSKVVDVFLKSLQFFQNRYGNYYLPEFRIIETERRGGYAPLGQFLLNTQFLKSLNDLGIFTIVHETAHQWFPHRIMFSPDYYLNESFAQYAAFAFCDSTGLTKHDNSLSKKFLFFNLGFEGDFNEFMRLREHIIYEESPAAGTTSDGSREYKWAAYYKGYFFLRSLALQTGTKIFDAYIKSLIEENKSKLISLDEFISGFENVSGKNLSVLKRDWLESNKVLDVEISDLESIQLSDGTFNSIVNVSSNGEIESPCTIALQTLSGGKYYKNVNSFSGGSAFVEITTPDEVVSAEADPDWYILDADRTNNLYPRKKKLSFIYSGYSVTSDQYFYYPSLTLSQADDVRIGFWAMNTYPILNESLKRNLVPVEWKAALFYGVSSKRAGYLLDVKSLLSVSDYRWEAGFRVDDFRGTDNQSVFLQYNFQKDENYFIHNYINVTAARTHIYSGGFYDQRDFQNGTSSTMRFNWDKLLKEYRIKAAVKMGFNLFGTDYGFTRLSFETENPFPSLTSWCSLRIFAGVVRGEFPRQESVFLSGSVNPDNFAYWLIDPGSNVSTQENLHTDGDANLRGFIGQHLRGENGFGINLNAPLPFFRMAELFVDLGNTWNDDFGSLKGDAGIGFNFQNLVRIDFPVLVSHPGERGNVFDFRWVIGVKF